MYRGIDRCSDGLLSLFLQGCILLRCSLLHPPYHGIRSFFFPARRILHGVLFSLFPAFFPLNPCLCTAFPERRSYCSTQNRPLPGVSSLSPAQIYLSSARFLFQNRYPAVLNLFVSQPGLPRKTFFLHLNDIDGKAGFFSF